MCTTGDLSRLLSLGWTPKTVETVHQPFGQEEVVTEKPSWVRLLEGNDATGLWEKLYWLVTRHSSVKSFIGAQGLSGDSATDAYLDMTQDLFVRLLEKDRWRYYLDANYSDETIDHELQHLEVPNLISLQLRSRHPEAFRITRRISNILKTSPEFKYYGSAAGRARASGRLVSRVYGLACWLSSMTMKEEAGLPDLVKSVHFRMRETRRSGRGRSSQIIISNKALCQLLVDIFNATQSLLDVRMIRLLALSKIAVEDSRFVSIDEQLAAPRSTQFDFYQIDVPDKRPTPEEILLDVESSRELDHLAESLLRRLKQGVRNKPRRFWKLIRVAWLCYFDPVSRSQGEIAALMGVSDSLVCHYRKLFDSYIREIDLPIDGWVVLNRYIERKLASILSDSANVQISEQEAAVRSSQATRAAAAYAARAAGGSLSARPLFSARGAG